MTQTLITPAHEKAGGGSAVARTNRISHPNVELLADMTVAQRNAVFRYLARFPDLDDAQIFYAYGHAYELAAKAEERAARARRSLALAA